MAGILNEGYPLIRTPNLDAAGFRRGFTIKTFMLSYVIIEYLASRKD
jgi:hypothetical protein